MCTVLAVSPVYTVKPFSTWSEPENLGEAVNSSYEEFLPELSKDELSLDLLVEPPGAIRRRRRLGVSAGQPRGPLGTSREPRRRYQYGVQRAGAGTVSRRPLALLREYPAGGAWRLRHLGVMAGPHPR